MLPEPVQADNTPVVCSACHHPRPRDGGRQTSVITSREALEASSGSCATCGILANGLAAILAPNGGGNGGTGGGGGDDADVTGTRTDSEAAEEEETEKDSRSSSSSIRNNGDKEWLRIDLNRANTLPSFEVHHFASDTAISLFISPTETGLPRNTLLLLPDVPIGGPPGHHQQVPTSTASSESFDWVRRKLERCQAFHNKSCGRFRHGVDVAVQQRIGDIGDSNSRSGPPPTRLLHIPNRLGNDQVRLCEVGSSSDDDDIESRCAYTALSHCWGPNPPLRTTAANIARHRRHGIAWDALPRTFREAIDFTRRLGLRYIWIDSLCIVQDDPGDWERESARMAAIYQNACLVISASNASGAHDGLYSDAASSPDYAVHTVNCDNVQQQQQQGVHGDRAAVDAESPSCRQVSFRRSYAHLPSPIQKQLQVSPDLPTLSRGWIYQERLLARRVVHFGPHELHWECMTESICQCRDTTNQDNDDDGAIRTPPPTTSAKPQFSIDHWTSLNPHQLCIAWHRLVENYTTLNLTFDKDIFPALSGIAQTFQTVKQSRYLAGLWRSSVLLDLLWYPNPPPPPGTKSQNTTTTTTTTPIYQHQPWQQQRPTTWRAPSWSWASIKGPVEYINTHTGLEPLCSVIECDVQHSGIDETGQLHSGYLVLQGHAMTTRATFRTPPDNQPEKYRPWNLLNLDILQKHVANVWADCNWSRPGGDLPSTLLCFVLGECKPSGALTMLMLRPADGVSSTACPVYEPVYERVGLVQVSKPPFRQSSAHYWLQAFPMETVTVKII